MLLVIDMSAFKRKIEHYSKFSMLCILFVGNLKNHKPSLHFFSSLLHTFFVGKLILNYPFQRIKAFQIFPCRNDFKSFTFCTEHFNRGCKRFCRFKAPAVFLLLFLLYTFFSLEIM